MNKIGSILHKEFMDRFFLVPLTVDQCQQKRPTLSLISNISCGCIHRNINSRDEMMSHDNDYYGLGFISKQQQCF